MSLFGKSKQSERVKEQSERFAELADERKLLLEALRVDAARFAAKVRSGVPIEKDYGNGPQIQSYSGRIEYVASFLSSGGPVNYANFHGESMLHFAAEGWQPEILRLLLSSGASKNAQDKSGRTAVHRWVDGPSPSVCETLHWKDSELAERQKESLDVMRDHDCLMDLLDSRGAAPLHVAVHERKYDATYYLLLTGANILQVTNRGGTALLFAFLNDDHKTAALLLDWGADPHEPLHTAEGTLADLVIKEGSESMKAVFALVT